eukprot:TRINITY_DN19740_c0_g1_i1.p1 TRINITY_DN19740_c0_g1~~TRINITY_DN19740_c0_g1_i1.p1  ORF type:complete len:120 (-),score=23.88 TRINITY_DN19740_c0_g1_i1:37-396(-)
MRLARKFITRYGCKEFASTSPYNRLKKMCEEKNLGVPKIRQAANMTTKDNGKSQFSLYIRNTKIGEVYAQSRREAEERLYKIAMNEIPRVFSDLDRTLYSSRGGVLACLLYTSPSPRDS